MKISKDRLKELIKEELSCHKCHDEQLGDEDYPKDPHGYEGRMVKNNLWKIAEYASEVYDLVHDDEDLEPWVEEKIAIAAYMLDSVGHYVKYEKHRGHEDAEGEKDHFELPHDENHEEEHGEEMHGDEEFEMGEPEEYEMDGDADVQLSVGGPDDEEEQEDEE